MSFEPESNYSENLNYLDGPDFNEDDECYNCEPNSTNMELCNYCAQFYC